LLPILRQEEAKKVLLNQYLVAQFQYNKSDDTYTCPPGEILKPREDGTRKAVELSKAVII
jgi:hypothetical protein